jgi:hypothetical protein
MTPHLPRSHTLGSRLRWPSAAESGVRRLFWLVAAVASCAVTLAGEPAAGVKPLTRAHAHNDYAHARPLADALDHGFTSIEVDVYLVDGKLLVAHNRPDVRPEKTLEALYLDPLLARVKANGGRVYPGGPEVTLLIEFKADGEAAYDVLAPTLARYREMLSSLRDGKWQPRAVAIVVTGERPRKKIEADKNRCAGIDGRIADLDSDAPPHFMPLISENWTAHFQWRGKGTMPDKEREFLRSFVARAHAKGRRVRFWATPETIETWRELDAAGVDLINTDDLAGLARHLGGK